MHGSFDARDLGFLPERLELINNHIEKNYLTPGKLPFADLLIGRGEEVVHRWTKGVDEDAIFRIASMTKPITSIAFMQLVEQGKAALNDPVSKYIPEFKNLGVFVSGGGNQPFMKRQPLSEMRVVDLMRHTSGLTYGFQERTPVDAAYRESELENWIKTQGDDEFIKMLARIPLDFDPGSSWNYSVSTDVLGVIVARISGMSLGEYFAQHIFKPLGMVDTGFAVPQSDAHRIPDCYVYHPSKLMEEYDAPGKDSAWAGKANFQSGGGGLASTTADYHRFCKMLLNGGQLGDEHIIAPKTLELMAANHLPGGVDLTQISRSLFSEADNAGHAFGLGFGVVTDPAATLVPCSKGEFHWGGMFSTGFFIDPLEDITMIFMTQLMPSSQYPIRREIKTMLYSAMVG